MRHHDRPQRSCGKVMFFTRIILFTGGGVCHSPCLVTPPRWADTPRPVHAGIHTYPAQCMLGYTHPHPVHAGIHPHPVHAGIRSTSGRHASYWNAFLLMLALTQILKLTCNTNGSLIIKPKAHVEFFILLFVFY